LYNGTYSAPHHYPILFGHEWFGIVEKTGIGVLKIKPGDYVIMLPVIAHDIVIIAKPVKQIKSMRMY
jgi:D-arabinose 1-dehydrogenase-like Zn-dependent alcohol dehydrogenase